MQRFSRLAYEALIVSAAIAGALGCWYIRTHSVPTDAATSNACRLMGDCEPVSVRMLNEYLSRSIANAHDAGAATCERKKASLAL